MSAEETREWGKQLGRHLRKGDVVALIGDLGAGKTSLAQGIGEGLGVTGPMPSPTFTLIQEYDGQNQGAKVRLVHMDLYRLQHLQEVEVIGVEEFFAEDTVCLIEWPEIAEDYLPENRLVVEILGSGEQPRKIVFHIYDETWDVRIKDIIHFRERLGGPQ